MYPSKVPLGALVRSSAEQRCGAATGNAAAGDLASCVRTHTAVLASRFGEDDIQNICRTHSTITTVPIKIRKEAGWKSDR